MAIRITGMNSGLDTENIISELVKMQKTKTDTIKKKQTSQQWKQDAWKDLNAKVLKLFNGTLSNLRFSDAYSKKTTNVSNASGVSVVTGANAVNGVQELKVKELATSGYLTGGQLSKDGSVTSATKLSDLPGSAVGADEDAGFSVTVDGKTTEISLKGSSTIDDVITKLRDAGVNANFDEKNQRLFISSKETGTKADFAITANNQGGFNALSALQINVADSATTAQYQKYADMTAQERQAMIDADVTLQVNALKDQLEAMRSTVDGFNTKIDTFLAENPYNYNAGTDFNGELDRLAAEKSAIGENPASDEDKAKLAEINKQITAVQEHTKNVTDKEAVESNMAAVAAKIGDGGLGTGSTEFVAGINDAWNAKFAMADAVAAGTQTGFSAGATRIQGQDAEITLNGAKFTASNNVFEINGLTMTVSQKTAEGESITLTTGDDTEGIYDTVKNFIKEYNAIINEMDKLYNAATNKSYQPLTEEEKAAMSDKEAEKWEEKVKESLLRRDSTLGNVSSAIKGIMAEGFEINGKTMHLFDFGIQTQSYFTAPENEKNAYHIDGDADNTTTSNNTDLLKAMIASDPKTVEAFFSELSKSLYGKMNDLMQSTDYSSSFSLYEDKKMKEEYNNYSKKIAEQEARVKKLEDKYYKQFSVMEVALAKLQSSQSALSGLLGG